MNDWKLRSVMLMGMDAVNKLTESNAAVFGVGGVGSFAAETLARSGVGRITLIDHDTISETNINRQLPALHSTLGRHKAAVMAERCQDINPDSKITVYNECYDAGTRERLLSGGYDIVLDCIDTVSCKLDLIEACKIRGIDIISALGAGNRMKPLLLRLGDISETHTCPLARVVRKELRARGITRHDVLWSAEEPVKPADMEEPPPGRRSVPASMCWVPGCAGMILAGEAVKRLAGI